MLSAVTRFVKCDYWETPMSEIYPERNDYPFELETLYDYSLTQCEDLYPVPPDWEQCAKLAHELRQLSCYGCGQEQYLWMCDECWAKIITQLCNMSYKWWCSVQCADQHMWGGV